MSSNTSSLAFPAYWPIQTDWTDRLREIFQERYLHELNQFVLEQRSKHTVYPAAPDVFRAFRLTSFAETKVVILGQDPYHGPGQAHGLSFSVKDETKFPPSLRNIFRELADDLGTDQPKSGNLTSWAEQGVLLLNTVLTVREGNANSHRKMGWELFTDEVIRLLGHSRNDRVVFLLWGKPAEKKTRLISDCHPILTSPHPSPLSAHRGFFGSRPFSRANEALIRAGRSPICWESVITSSSV